MVLEGGWKVTVSGSITFSSNIVKLAPTDKVFCEGEADLLDAGPRLPGARLPRSIASPASRHNNGNCGLAAAHSRAGLLAVNPGIAGSQPVLRGRKKEAEGRTQSHRFPASNFPRRLIVENWKNGIRSRCTASFYSGRSHLPLRLW